MRIVLSQYVCFLCDCFLVMRYCPQTVNKVNIESVSIRQHVNKYLGHCEESWRRPDVGWWPCERYVAAFRARTDICTEKSKNGNISQNKTWHFVLRC